MSENTQAVETEALEQDVIQEEQVETKQESQRRSQRLAQLGSLNKQKPLSLQRAKVNASRN